MAAEEDGQALLIDEGDQGWSDIEELESQAGAQGLGFARLTALLTQGPENCSTLLAQAPRACFIGLEAAMPRWDPGRGGGG